MRPFGIYLFDVQRQGLHDNYVDNSALLYMSNSR